MSTTRKAVAVVSALALSGLTLGTSEIPAVADSTMTATTGVNIRSTPSTGAKIVGGLYRGQTVTAMSTAGSWTKIRFRSGTGYVSTQYLKGGAGVPSRTTSQTRVTTTAVNLRKGPGLSYAKITLVKSNTSVTLTGKAARGYSQVRVKSTTGWIASQYLKASSGLPMITGRRIATADLLIRSTSGRDFKVLGEIAKGTTVSITGATQNGRAQIIYRNAARWVTAKYLANPSKAGPVAPGLPKITGTRYATTTLILRSTAGNDFKTITEVATGTQLSITGVVKNGRMQVVYHSAAGWVTAKYLSTKRPAVRGYPVERGLKPNAVKVHRAVRANFPQITSIGGVRPDPIPDHPSGRALDLMIPNYKSASGKALGQKVALWAKANARSLGIEYVIWNQHIWNIKRNSEGWRYMAGRGSDSANHKNHVHVTVFG
ncbi:MAG: SH3 domain-containing protein [Microlunatus sp.]|nr:SH3 domain-containing protein [Microlunatus sp.]MDN5770001.1 SH3 domain-containing protein [Microlunatus sp.]